MKIYQEDLETMKRIVADYTEQVVDFEIEAKVQAIITQVRKRGDQALIDYARQFDGVSLTDLKVAEEQLEQAWLQLDDSLKTSLKLAAQNITSFHELEKEKGFVDASQAGIVRGQKVTPLKRVGLYVPGGTAAYPSTILMNAIPAKLAGVEELVVVTPPQKEGINQAVLAAAKLAGVDAIYQVGGAQAIAALAYGT
ncbi:MAG: histidinol dehydrogenase, partial [Ligilactobacillus agilis]|nr:histidinol dehydrogenase [Ligilactobacillus agilis]